MPTPAKTLDAMSKNLTSDEKDARSQAEASVILSWRKPMRNFAAKQKTLF